MREKKRINALNTEASWESIFVYVGRCCDADYTSTTALRYSKRPGLLSMASSLEIY